MNLDLSGMDGKAPKPGDKKLRHSEGAASFYLDAEALGDTDQAQEIWQKLGGKIDQERGRGPVVRRHLGSWNFWPQAMVATLLADNKQRAEKVNGLIEYCHRQLNRTVEERHDLWGKETLSRIYTWPVVAMARAYDWAVDNGQTALERALRDLCTAHAYTLALFALPHRYPSKHNKVPIYVCAPGMRSAKFEMGFQISYITAVIMNRGVTLDQTKGGAGKYSRGYWACRVARKCTHRYLEDSERNMLWEHCRLGNKADEIVARLNALGVTFRTPVQVWRYEGDDFVALAKSNVHGSTPPIMAMSRVDGQYHHLMVHPRKMRGEGGLRLGNPSKCWQEGGRVHTVFKNAIVVKDGEFVELRGSIAAPPDDAQLLFAVRIGIGNGTAQGNVIRLDDPAARTARLDGLLAQAQRIAELAAGQETAAPGIFRHAAAIGRLASFQPPEPEKIYLRSRAIERLDEAGRIREEESSKEREIADRAATIIELYRWWG